MQLPPLQVVPPEQTVPQVPQFALSLLVIAHAPPWHWVVPVGQLDEQLLLLQTAVVPVQVVVQLPQWVASDWTQALLHRRSPVLHAHWPAVQLWPDPQTLPQVPQFCESVERFVQPEVHAVSLALQVGPPPPLIGLAQLATKSEAPWMATRAACKEAWRASMFKLLNWGNRGQGA